MHWSGTSVLVRFRFRLTALATIALLTSVYLLLPTAWVFPRLQRSDADHSIDSDDGFRHADSTEHADTRPLPDAYSGSAIEVGLTSDCEAKFGIQYLRAFGSSPTQYCNSSSASRLLCFRNSVGGKYDSFCTAGPTKVQPGEPKISIDCSLRDLTDSERSSGVPNIRNFPQYWYNTGPRAIFNDFIKLENIGLQTAVDNVEIRPAKYSLLVKREANNDNMWHEMMEIMSLTMSLDILRMTVDTATDRPFYTDADRTKTQVVLLDTLADGPFHGLWQIAAGLPTIRLNETLAGVDGLGQVVLPLPGGSNPLWSGDWKELDCGRSALLSTFSNRVLDFYKVQRIQPVRRERLTLTFISRDKKRRLIHKIEFVSKLREVHADVNIILVDYATLSFSEQIRVTHSTDILVGVHGAGLTHGMFLPLGSTIVEILPPALEHKGFQNMAHFLGHTHFGIHGDKRDNAEISGDWHVDDVVLEETAFMDLMSKAITATKAARSGA